MKTIFIAGIILALSGIASQADDKADPKDRPHHAEPVTRQVSPDVWCSFSGEVATVCIAITDDHQPAIDAGFGMRY
jgi:hypothetical protein